MCGLSFVFGFCCRLHVFDLCQVKRLITYFTRHSAHPPAPPSGESVRVLCRLRTLQSRVTGHPRDRVFRLRTPGARAPQDRLSQHLPDTVLIVLLDVDIQIGKHAFLYTY